MTAAPIVRGRVRDAATQSAAGDVTMPPHTVVAAPCEIVFGTGARRD